MKKIASILLVLMLVLTMAAPALAEGGTTHTITITNTKSGHTYSAYQVFQGDITGGKLTNITWGNGVDGAALLAELKTLTAYEDCTSAEDVADVLASFDNDSEELDAFAEVVGKHLATAAGTLTETKDETSSTYTISVTGDGYYFVKDADNSVAEDDAYTKYILRVVGDVKVAAKAKAPTLEKKIVEGEDEVDANNASIGDKVNYKLTSKVPDMDGYDKYFFIVNDTLSKGLTFNDDVKITIDGKTLIKDTDYTVTKGNAVDADNDVTGTSIKIVFNDFLKYKSQKGKAIVITYSATLNEDAVIGNTGNPNTASLTYSNNPNVENKGQEGNENEPDVNIPTGKTPEDTVITYVTGIELTKVNEAGDRLEGAEFKITGTKLNKVKIIRDTFTVAEDGTYYKLKNGTYTETEPTDETKENYADENKYKLEKVVTWNTETVKVSATATVGSDGVLRFEGLGEGTYVIEEIKAPDGYNKLKDNITVVITCTEPAEIISGAETATWKYTVSGAVTVDETEATNGIITLTVENKAGAVLPSTGGMGTTIFYVLGGLLIVAAGVALITRRRMSK